MHTEKRPRHPCDYGLVTGFCFLTALVLLIGALSLACAHSPEQAQASLTTSDTISNVVASVRDNPVIRATPTGPIIEALCALAIAGLGVWNGYLHRQVNNGKLAAASAKAE